MRQLLPPSGFFAAAPKLQFVPIIVSSDGSYPIEANRYLDERCNGEWSPPHYGEEHGDPPILTLKSRQNLAARVCAFLHWCDQALGRNWRSMGYQEDILGQYQSGLLKGTASKSKRRLAAGTVNLYVDEACLFLSWAADRGYRGPFKVPRRRTRLSASRGAHSHSYRAMAGSQRLGTLQTGPASLEALPLASEVARWLSAVRVRHPIKSLAFELICRTGIRISEANQLRLACFPKKAYGQHANEWHPGWVALGWVPLTLRYGVKGGKVEPSSVLSTRSREVQVPIDLADRIWDYIQFIRPTLLSRYHRGPLSKVARTDRLWLGESKCQPVSNQMLYEAWVQSPHCPSDWHPHSARHFFAVEQVMEATRQLLRFHEIADPRGVSIGWLHGLMAGQVRLLLSPLLGHADERTSMRYLRCAMQRMARTFGHPILRWNELIDADLEVQP